MTGHAATTAMRIMDGATITFARRRSDIPLERRACIGAPARTEAASIWFPQLEGRERRGDLRVGLLQRGRGTHATCQRVVDVLVDRLRDLRIDRRDRTRLGLGERLLELGGVRDRLLDVRIV